MNIRSVAVFCGSQEGKNPVYATHAKELGRLLGMLKVKVVYGGAHKGLMGILADAVLKQEGQVMGVIPEHMIEHEVQHKKLTELSIVSDMHARKKMMYDRADAAIILPGGFGTLDEMFEMLTWNQLKLHTKKVYLLNSEGFFTHLLKHIALMEKEGFLLKSAEDRLITCQTPVEIFNQLN